MSDRDESSDERFTSSDLDPEQQAWKGELHHLLETALDEIPDAYRSVFVLREVEGLNTAEAAECLGVSEDVVKTRLHRARSLLRTELFERAGLASAEVFRFHLSRCDRVVSSVLARLDLEPPYAPHCNCPGDFCQKRSIEDEPQA